MSIPNPIKTRTWDLITPASGDFLDDEFDQIYENDNALAVLFSAMKTQYYKGISGKRNAVNANRKVDIAAGEFYVDGNLLSGVTTHGILYL